MNIIIVYYAGRFEKQSPDSKNLYYRPKTVTAQPTASYSTPARDTSASSVSAWDVATLPVVIIL